VGQGSKEEKEGFDARGRFRTVDTHRGPSVFVGARGYPSGSFVSLLKATHEVSQAYAAYAAALAMVLRLSVDG